MAIFGLKKGKGSDGTELVLAYVEEAQRLRTQLTVVGPKGTTLHGTVSAVTEERLSLTLQGPLLAEKGASVTLYFLMDGLRFKAVAKVQEVKPGAAHLDLPEALALAERRRSPRARLNAREGATATALTGLFDGVGISGPIENISEKGVAIRVERGMDVKTQRKLPLGQNLLAPGQAMMIIKLNKLPKCPPIELAGTVVYLDTTQGLLVGLAFEPGKEALLSPVKALVQSRTSAIPTSVPPKARRQPEAAAEPKETKTAFLPPARKEEEPEPAPPAPAAPAPEAAPPPAAAEPPSPAPAPPEPAATPAAEDRSQALKRVKKRTRAILLAMPDTPERSAVVQYLTEDGYGRLMIAETLTELLEELEPPGVNLVLVDDGVVELKGLSLASLIHHRMGDMAPKVVLAEPLVTAELVAGAQESGVAQILVKPYDTDADFGKMIERHLGI